jgi:hypothetical protein
MRALVREANLRADAAGFAQDDDLGRDFDDQDIRSRTLYNWD